VVIIGAIADNIRKTNMVARVVVGFSINERVDNTCGRTVCKCVGLVIGFGRRINWPCS